MSGGAAELAKRLLATSRHVENRLEHALACATVALDLGEVDRATMHPDGRRETDTTHTVMLGLLACELGARMPELGLDLGLVAQLALVHDLVEARAGDVDTAGGLSSAARAAKKALEARALQELRGALGWAPGLIDVYEAQQAPEAQFVHILDKLCPRLTEVLNGGAANRRRGFTPEQVAAACAHQEAELAEQHPALAGHLRPLLELAGLACAIQLAAPASGHPAR